DESTWARGEAWGIYGFAKAYQYTGDERFYKIAKNMAQYFITHLPKAGIPYWDFTLTADTNKLDASAAAIAACGLHRLSELAVDKSDVDYFKKEFLAISDRLLKGYTFTSSNRPVEQGILLHTVYHMPKGWGIDESYPCGDYYFIEMYHHRFDDTEKNRISHPQQGRSDVLLNSDWYYLEDNCKSVEQTDKSIKNWHKVTLPHTWNVHDVFDEVPGYRRDAGWYMKSIFLPDPGKNSYILNFEGVNLTADVYVNGKKVGSHVGGYVGFSFDITQHINKDAENTILVRADNSINHAIIPSQRSDFNIYGGITRNVYLQVRPAVSVGTVKISTPMVNEKLAEVHVETDINGITAAGKEFQLSIEVYDGSGKKVASDKIALEEFVKNKNLIELKIKKPLLWSPDSPNLYKLKLSLMDDKTLLDSVSEVFGCRWFEFKEKGAFYLNGKKLFLRGTHRHEDRAGYGNAMPDSLHRQDMAMIKELGANFVRLAHYPQAPEVYRACDELGLLVWDELPWCRGGYGDDEWKQNSYRLFKEQILQNFNHPSIIMWSVGNESDWNPDYEGGDNADTLYLVAKHLHDIAKALDSNRVTCTRKFEAAGKSVDVFSPSMWPGWYSDVYKSYVKVLETNRDKYKRIFHAEYGGDSHAGRHTENPITGEGFVPESDGTEKASQSKLKSIANNGDWSESYIVNLFDWYLFNQQKLDWFSGSAQWIFRDFGTPLRPENPIPYVNQKGLVDLNNNKKDAYYVFKSYWVNKPDFVHIYSHTWDFRAAGKNKTKEIKVFSNCYSVTLVINGVTKEMKKKDLALYPASGLVWNTELVKGTNSIVSIGYNESGVETCRDSMSITYTLKAIDKPESVTFTQKQSANGNYLITAEIVDQNNNRCTDFQGRVYFALSGSGKIIGYTGTPTNSPVIQAANGRAMIEVKTVPSEKAVIELRTQDLKGFYYTIQH
ncbi:MAG: glycoside hydrolase family 88 protein, partial [Ignavibacteriales bacterium]|nr:glycoside hydrolase family 88 protein [Ignavibacteriales bacterium]